MLPRPRPRRPLGILLGLLFASSGGAQSTPDPIQVASLPRRSPDSLARLWSPAVEKAVDAGLVWLARTQHAKGFWTGAVGHKRGDSYMVFGSVAQQRVAQRGHIGISALAGMAFLAGGSLPNRGKYGREVTRALDYVLAHVGEGGLVTDSGTRMYSHAFATLFLAEVCGVTRDPRIKKGLEKAVHMIVDCQNVHGAWRYNPFSTEADLSVTVCQLQALRAARNIGIQVPRKTIERAVAYVRASQTTSGHAKGLFYYKIKGRGAFRKNTQFAINAAAVTALVSAGVYEKALMAPAVHFLIDEVDAVQEWYPHHFYFWYGNYYACQALYHAEGLIRDRCFKDYYRGMKKHLLKDQRADGRWRNDVGPGDVFATAVACIVLQVPKQYLPIFQR